MAEPVPIVEQALSAVQREFARQCEIARKIEFSRVITGPPPSGYADVIVYQHNMPPGPKPTDPAKLPAWEERKRKYDKDYFVLPDTIKPITGIADLLVIVAGACSGGKRLRQLRIMGHGAPGQIRIGTFDVVYYSSLYDPSTKQKTKQAQTLETLKQWLDPEVSLVILDHCNTGESDKFLVALSDLWGGVAVRAFRHFQGWEHGEIQVGNGPFRQCKGNTCHFGFEYHPDQAANDPGQ